MERGVYFDAWFPRQHCYHPSLPPRRLKMIEDLESYRATALVWSALGGGSISLPYLEQEAWQKIDPRFRMYGFINDAEFIQHCQKKGIKVFGIVFEVQGWEFPVELNETEDEILALNELRGEGKKRWLGLREFTQNRYPKLWRPLEHYFSGGLVNSDGEQVTDLLEECVSRDIFGAPCHSTWVECPDREHYAYLMDRNNPVWREYLKAIIRIQIDAGVAGVQLDEADLPIFATGYGGCFCKDCMKLFKAYLQKLPAQDLPKELEGEDLEAFHYGSWLLQRGYDFKANRESTPLYWDYIRFQRQTIVEYFGELADYIKSYGAQKGRDVQVSGNFYYLSPHYYPFEPKTDILITEMDSTSYRQPSWCRYSAGFAGGKPVIVVENPYGGVPPELLPKLKSGQGYDLFRMMQYEASALGINERPVRGLDGQRHRGLVLGAARPGRRDPGLHRRPRRRAVLHGDLLGNGCRVQRAEQLRLPRGARIGPSVPVLVGVRRAGRGETTFRSRDAAGRQAAAGHDHAGSAQPVPDPDPARMQLSHLGPGTRGERVPGPRRARARDRRRRTEPAR